MRNFCINNRKYTELQFFALFLAIMLITACNKQKIIFSDHFEKDSEGMTVDNIIQLPPPAGLGYTWKVLEKGALPMNWVMYDTCSVKNPLKGFWVIQPDSGYLEQAGRSHNSVLFARTPVPCQKKEVEISFRQYRNDNDYVGYLIAEDTDGGRIRFEAGYMTQVPGTDSTTADAYVRGALGEVIVRNAALTHKWAMHRFVFRNDSALWYINNLLMVSGSFPSDSICGYFGIRHRYERGTRYDDAVIKIN